MAAMTARIMANGDCHWANGERYLQFVQSAKKN